MSRPNIPRKDSDAAAWMRIFATRLQAFPDRYFVPAEEIEAVATAVADFRSALAVTLVPSTRTTPATTRKNLARAAAERVCRRVYTMIKSDPRITTEDKLAVGVRLDKPRRSRSKPPATRPVLRIDTRNGVHTVTWTDETSRRRAKPAGCAMLQLFLACADGEAGERLALGDGQALAERIRLLNVYTSNRVTVFNDELRRWDTGGAALQANGVRTAVFVARWAGPKGQAGPWSAPSTLRLAA